MDPAVTASPPEDDAATADAQTGAGPSDGTAESTTDASSGASDEASGMSTTTDFPTSDGPEPSSSTGDASTTGAGECRDDVECGNGSACDGVEACVNATCEPGEPVDCDDAVACTIDACNEPTGACEHVAFDVLCSPSEICLPVEGCVPSCVPSLCFAQTYACGNCIDDDGDGAIDMADPECWGPCDNNESGWDAAVPGDDGSSPCGHADCFFDVGTGGPAYDDCHWSLSCDPLEPWWCTYDPTVNIAGGNSCNGLAQAQSDACISFCLPRTPNGCDCFGCCEVPTPLGAVTVFLGTQLGNESGADCHLGVIDDPAQCHPCTQVPSCLNACDECEVCLGKPAVPPACTPAEQCPAGQQVCGLPGQSPCPSGSFCNTGCCAPNPM